MISASIADALVAIVGGEVVADSRDVAEAFGRHHRHVLRDIGDLVERRPDLAPTFGRKVARIDIGSGAKRDTHYYTMNRKGFVVLVGGFKGDRALDFRIAFYDAFERMEAMLRRIADDERALSAPVQPAILDDHDRLRNAIAFVRAAHVAKRCVVARRAWAVAGLPDVFAAGALERVAGAAAFADPAVVAWSEDRLEHDPAARASTAMLFEDYQYWAAMNGHPAMSLAMFGRQLSAMGIEGFRSDGIKRRGVRLRPLGEVA
ncbi:Rha family transcriptional regulator [Sphingomonas sp. S17]|uniref:Rha family transcriptional regulator n=1 Tax=Sphingomonas sp. S17 TaxID=1007104 RepID=UPI000A0189C2|nr:Rha family transcriptional regulator [Sphingomonas sp. S17]